MKKILLVYPKLGPSGNLSTINRLSLHVDSAGYEPVIKDLESAVISLQKEQHLYSAIITIHAGRSASLIPHVENSIPLILIFGGTDLNERPESTKNGDAMESTVSRASKCVVFNYLMKEIAESLWPKHIEKVVVIHQSISTNPKHGFDIREHIFKVFGVTCQRVVLLVTGIRKVKDPTYLLKEFSESHIPSAFGCVFVVVGPLVDPLYSNYFQDYIKDLPHVIYVGELDSEGTHAAIRQSLCLVNSSHSEGMSCAILEAFSLGTPVIARDIPGNAYIIEHGVNGYLYSTPYVFLKQLELLIENEGIAKFMAHNANFTLQQNFSFEKERAQYKALLTGIS